MALEKVAQDVKELQERIIETSKAIGELDARLDNLNAMASRPGAEISLTFSENISKTLVELHKLESSLIKDIDLRDRLLNPAQTTPMLTAGTVYPAMGGTFNKTKALPNESQFDIPELERRLNEVTHVTKSAYSNLTIAEYREYKIREDALREHIKRMESLSASQITPTITTGNVPGIVKGTPAKIPQPSDLTFIEQLNKSLPLQGQLWDKVRASILSYAKSLEPTVGKIASLTNVSYDLNNETIRVEANFRTADLAVAQYRKTLSLTGEEITKTAAATRQLTPQEQTAAFANPAYAEYFKLGARLGFGKEDLKTITDRASTGVKTLTSRLVEEGGVVHNLTASVDEFGRVMFDTPRRMLPFGQAVARDFVELSKWTIAIGLIYGPIRKLQEITTLMIQNQTKLADATIAVSNAEVDAARIFRIAADAANAIGEPINKVIEGYTLAYRATGGLGDVQIRTAAASKLTVDSLILSKLAAMNQATAIDTLSASLRQEGMGLDQGRVLLDKWVRTTKVANVDLNTLATSFAILGDSADAAGLSIDELNGLIATIAATGVASGREAANMGRAIVSGFQSQRAASELQKFGIAVNDVTNNQLRPFMSVMKEIYDLKQSGVISESELSKITLALGGGTRRQAVYTAFLENFGMVQRTAAESALAHGDAEEALALKLDIVQTSITKLGNAFQSLAQSLGTEGGILDIFKLVIDSATTLVNLLDKLTIVLGKMGPLLYTVAIGAGLMKMTNTPMAKVAAIIGSTIAGVRLSSITGKGGVTTTGVETLGGAGVAGIAPALTRRQQLGVGARNFLAPSTGNLLATNIMKGALLTAIPIIWNLSNKEDKYGKIKAGADIAGAIAGGLIAQGNPIGMVIGAAIAEAFVAATIARRTDLMAYEPYAPKEIAPATEKVSTKALEDAEAALYASFPGGKIGAAIAQMLTNEGIKVINRDLAKKRRALLPEVTLEQIAYEGASPQARAQMDAARKAAQISAGEYIPSEFATGQRQLQTRDAAILAKIKAQQETVFRTQLATGELTGGKFTNAIQNLGTFAERATGFYQAFGKQLEDTSNRVNNASDAYSAFMDIIAYGSEEETQALTNYKSLIKDLQGWIELANEAIKQGIPSLNIMLPGETERTTRTPQQIIAIVTPMLQDSQRTIAQAVSRMLIDIQYNKIKIPPIVGGEAVSMEAAMKGLTDAYREQSKFLKTIMEPEDIQEFEKRVEDFTIVIGEGGDKIYIKMSEIAQKLGIPLVAMEWYTQAIQDAAETAKQMDIQRLDITKSQLGQLTPGAGGTYDWARAIYESLNTPEHPTAFAYNPEDVGIITTDNATQILHVDLRVLALALEKITDIEQKQLDGMYNLPEGATFWVPITAAYYRRGGGGGGGGTAIPPVPPAAPAAPAVPPEKLPPMGEKPYPEQTPLEEMKAIRAWQASSGGYKYSEPVIRKDKLWDELFQAQKFVPKGSTKEFKKEKEIPYPGWWGPGVDYKPLLDSIMRFFEGLRNLKLPDLWGKTPPVGLNTTNMNTAPVSRISIGINNKTQLIVDGKILATVIKPYFINDLIRSQRGYGTYTKISVI